MFKNKLRDRFSETTDRQITTADHGHILTNVNIWSPDGRRIVYDTRSTADGSIFDGRSIETVDITTGEVRVIYDDAPCGVVTFDPNHDRVVFIRGPKFSTPEWSYSATHREGVIVDLALPGKATVLDARDLIPPFTPGALRGGSHVHVFSPDSKLIVFTYEDAYLETHGTESTDRNARAVGVTRLDHPVKVPPGEHHEDGAGFSVLVTALTNGAQRLRRGVVDDAITRAREEAWVGTHGYQRPDGTRQNYALAFQGQIADGTDEVFIVDLPGDLTRPGDGPLQGTETRRPLPPAGTVQRQLTHNTGIHGPRHWLRSSPDGSAIGFLHRDDQGVVQFHTVSPYGGPVRQVTHSQHGIESSFTWSPDGRRVAAVIDRSVCTIDITTGDVDRLTRRSPGDDTPRPEACVFSPDGTKIAYIRHLTRNQIFVVTVPAK